MNGKKAIAFVISSLLIFVVGLAIYSRLSPRIPAIKKIVEG